MPELKELLKQWTLQFVKSRDAFFKKIVSIDASPATHDAKVTYKDGRVQHFIISPSLQETLSLLNAMGKEDHFAIATLNSAENRKSFLAHWKSYTPFKNLIVYFINPFSSGERKWCVAPYTHSKVCEDSALDQGFRSLGELVEEISLEQASAKAHREK